jgi:glyoxylase-like metal-dependent hydrolase (beta-lactamase superfamily II)
MRFESKFCAFISEYIYTVKYQLKFFEKILGDTIKFGNESIIAMSTPGHTNGCMSFVSHKAKIVFTGDALLIRGCGRTDFQNGKGNLI